MKPLLFLIFSFASLSVKPQNTYRNYLLSEIWQHPKVVVILPATSIKTTTTCLIPRYEIPKGNVFCRLEDKLTRISKVWIKVGVK